MFPTVTVFLSAFVFFVLGSPATLDTLVSRAEVDNIVYVTDAQKFWCVSSSSEVALKLSAAKPINM
jgi:hypothetical protein